MFGFTGCSPYLLAFLLLNVTDALYDYVEYDDSDLLLPLPLPRKPARVQSRAVVDPTVEWAALLAGSAKLKLPNYCDEKTTSAVVKTLETKGDKVLTYFADDMVGNVSSIGHLFLPFLDSFPEKGDKVPEDEEGTYYAVHGLHIGFNKSRSYYKVMFDLNTGIYKIGGWNQVWMSCPAPLCLDSRVDAAFSLPSINPHMASKFWVLRGKYLWEVDEKDQKTAPMMSRALRTESMLFKTMSQQDAAMSDLWGNVILMQKHYISGYLIDKQMISFTERAVKGLTTTFYWSKFRALFLKQFGAPVKGILPFGPIDTKIFNREIPGFDALLYDKNTETPTIYGFHKSAYFIINPINMNSAIIKIFVDNFKPNGAYEKQAKIDILKLIPNVKGKVFSGMKPISDLNPEWPKNLDAAISTPSGKAFLFKDWSVWSFDVKDITKLKTVDMKRLMKRTFALPFNCPAALYAGLGFGGVDDYIKEYVERVEGFGVDPILKIKTPKPTILTQKPRVTRTPVPTEGVINNNKSSKGLIAVLLVLCFLVLMGILVFGVLGVLLYSKRKRNQGHHHHKKAKGKRGGNSSSKN